MTTNHIFEQEKFTNEGTRYSDQFQSHNHCGQQYHQVTRDRNATFYADMVAKQHLMPGAGSAAWDRRDDKNRGAGLDAAAVVQRAAGSVNVERPPTRFT